MQYNCRFIIIFHYDIGLFIKADAIWAAYRKALELGGNDSNVGPGRSKTAK